MNSNHRYSHSSHSHTTTIHAIATLRNGSYRTYDLAAKVALALHGSKWPAYLTIYLSVTGNYKLGIIPTL